MNIMHWVRRENSGLMHTTLELIEEEERQGHEAIVREPSTGNKLYGNGAIPDIHMIHSQLGKQAYHDDIPKLMMMHGEPLGSVGNGISMRAIVDLASSCEAFICMRKEEWPVWNAIRKTYIVQKGVDLNRFKPMEVEKLPGEPAVLYYENWRGQRNPLLLCLAMREVQKKLPGAKLHLYNCPGGKMYETFNSLLGHCRWNTFIHSLRGQEKDVVKLLNRSDIVVSCLYPLYARGIEAFGCGKAFIGPGYKEPSYPYQCELDAQSMADAIIKCWEERGKVDFRKWAQEHHNVETTVKQMVEIYGKYA